MLCLARQIPLHRTAFQLLTRRPLPTTTNWLTPLVRISNYADIREPSGSRPQLNAKKLNRKAQKKALRTERRAQEKEEAKIPGTTAAIKAELKAQKIAKKLERRARVASGEPLTEEADIKTEEQSSKDREVLAKKHAEPVKRQERREYKRRDKYLDEVPERGLSGEKWKSSEWEGRKNEPRDTPFTRGTKDFSGRTAGTENRISTYKSRDDKTWGSGWSPMDTDASSSIKAPTRLDRRQDRSNNRGEDRPRPTQRMEITDRTRNTFDRQSGRSEERPWRGRSRDETAPSSRPDRGQDSFDRKARTERPRERGERSATPFASKSRSDEPYEKPKREQWMVQKEAIKKKFGDEAWAPKKRLSPDTLEAIRTMHTSDPDRFSTPLLAEQFKVSPEVIRRILRTKWQPDEATVQDRQERWARRGERIWTKQAELGVRPPKKWREMGVANPGEPGVAPKWKKNAHTRDKYGEQMDHFVAQRKGASVDTGYKKPFSERML